jgi:hypothetical protein
VPHSAVTGGGLNLDNTASSGAGVVLYSNRGADALGRLLVVNQANPSNPQHAVRIQNVGTAHTVSIFHDPAAGAGDPAAEAVDIVSTNERDTALGVRGRETGKGTVKITHGKPSGSDANASALSIALEEPGRRARASTSLDLSLEEMGFLRLLLTNASVQPAELKKLCGEVQAKVEAHIGPLPPG